MLMDREITANSEYDEWSIQSENWLSEASKLQKPRLVRERNSNALIVTGHGASMGIDKGALVIRDGLTHYPQQRQTHRFFKGDLNLPRCIMLLDGSGSLSFETLSWLAEQEVALARIDWRGKVAIVASSSGYASSFEKIAWQRHTAKNMPARVLFSIDLIGRKLQSSIETLEIQFAQSALRDKAIGKIQNCLDDLKRPDIADVSAVRIIEGIAAFVYFAAWVELKIEWKGTGQYPIPDHWRQYRTRSSLATGKKAENRAASHPVNAMLNYAYKVKQAHLQIAAIGNGYDPTIGVMHHGKKGNAAFIFDMIEPERPLIDNIILAFVQSRTFSGADFIIRSDGACRLSPQLAKVIASLVI